MPSKKLSYGTLHANIKSQITDSKAELYLTGVKKSNGDFNVGLTRPLPAEIVFPPFSAIRKELITSERYKIDGKCQQNTDRE
jgi:hypothetical protein